MWRRHLAAPQRHRSIQTLQREHLLTTLEPLHPPPGTYMVEKPTALKGKAETHSGDSQVLGGGGVWPFLCSFLPNSHLPSVRISCVRQEKNAGISCVLSELTASSGNHTQTHLPNSCCLAPRTISWTWLNTISCLHVFIVFGNILAVQILLNYNYFKINLF